MSDLVIRKSKRRHRKQNSLIELEHFDDQSEWLQPEKLWLVTCHEVIPVSIHFYSCERRPPDLNSDDQRFVVPDHILHSKRSDGYFLLLEPGMFDQDLATAFVDKHKFDEIGLLRDFASHPARNRILLDLI
jgi:hypothetical protein